MAGGFGKNGKPERHPHRNLGIIQNLEKVGRRYTAGNGEVQYPPKNVDIYSFDSSYLRHLQQGDPATETHFSLYFYELMKIKLRGRKLPLNVIEEVQQETFLRVLRAVRDGQVQKPESLGAYVNSVCNRVLMEYFRGYVRNLKHVDLDSVDIADIQDVEGKVLEDENQRNVSLVLNELSERDSGILRAIVMDEQDKSEVCREFRVERGYLRVLLHRAKENFKSHCKAKEIDIH